MQQFYEVHPSQLRWAMHNLAAQGVPIQGYSTLPNGMCVIVITLPESTPAPDWRSAPRRKPGIELGSILKWSLFMLVVLVFCATLYMVWGSVGANAQQPSQQGQQQGSAWAWLSDLHFPWQGEPAQVEQQGAEQQDGGFRWPWDAAADAAESVQMTVTMVSVVIVTVLVLMIVLVVVRKRR